MDELDEVTNLEHRAYEEGIEAGRVAATSSDIRDAGVMSGIVKGYELGLELGFMQNKESEEGEQKMGIGATNGKEVDREESPSMKGSDCPDVSPKSDESATNGTVFAVDGIHFNSEPENTTKSFGSRVEKRRVMLAERIAHVPQENIKEFDFKGELESIRALYRSCNSPAGPLVREGSTVRKHVAGNIETW